MSFNTLYIGHFSPTTSTVHTVPVVLPWNTGGGYAVVTDGNSKEKNICQIKKFKLKK